MTATWREADLVDAREIASRLGLASHRIVLDWRLHHFDFPRPVTRRATYLWNWPEVDAWRQSHEHELARWRRARATRRPWRRAV